jgi:hypothetical protein
MSAPASISEGEHSTYETGATSRAHRAKRVAYVKGRSQEMVKKAEQMTKASEEIEKKGDEVANKG